MLTHRTYLGHAKQTKSKESASIQLFAGIGNCAHHLIDRHFTVQDLKNTRGMQKDVELPVLPTGPGHDSDIVNICVNLSCVTLCIP
jgi:hypothetical protein